MPYTNDAYRQINQEKYQSTKGRIMENNHSVSNMPATLSEVADYLCYLKHDDVDEPIIGQKSLSLATAIATGLGDINDFGLKNKHKQLFAGAITFHRNKLCAMIMFFNDNKDSILDIKDEIIESKLDGHWLGFASGLANYYSNINEIVPAYTSLTVFSTELSSKQQILRNTMVSNLLRQTLLYAEAEYEMRLQAA